MFHVHLGLQNAPAIDALVESKTYVGATAQKDLTQTNNKPPPIS